MAFWIEFNKNNKIEWRKKNGNFSSYHLMQSWTIEKNWMIELSIVGESHTDKEETSVQIEQESVE